MTEDELFPSSGLVIQELDPSAEVAVKEILIEAGIDIQGQRLQQWTTEDENFCIKTYNEETGAWEMDESLVGIISVSDDSEGQVYLVLSKENITTFNDEDTALTLELGDSFTNSYDEETNTLIIEGGNTL